MLEVHCEIGRYLEVYQRYGGERQHKLGDGQADGERLLGHAGRPFLDARLVQPDVADVNRLDVLVQQQRHHDRERHEPNEHQRFGHATPEHRSPRVPHNREIPADRQEQHGRNCIIGTVRSFLWM